MERAHTKNQEKKSKKKKHKVLLVEREAEDENQVPQEEEDKEEVSFKNKMDRLEKAHENINFLWLALEQQNKLASRVLRIKAEGEQGQDLEKVGTDSARAKQATIFKSRKPMTQEERQRLEQEERELTHEERALLDKFDRNDQEIEQMLTVVIQQLDRLNFSAQGIGQKIDEQGKLLQKLNQRIEVSWTKLERRDNDLKKVLETYRSQNKFCVDVLLILLILALLYFAIWLYKAKGYL